MRIPNWTPALKPQPQDLVDAILKRRGGTLIALDKALLWSEPLARGWNVYLKAVRTDLPTSPKLRELGICTVALLTGADYEYKHHAPDFLKAGGTQAELDALNAVVKVDARQSAAHPALGAVEQLVIRYAAQMTLDVKVTTRSSTRCVSTSTRRNWSSWPAPLPPTTWSRGFWWRWGFRRRRRKRQGNTTSSKPGTQRCQGC